MKYSELVRRVWFEPFRTGRDRLSRRLRIISAVITFYKLDDEQYYMNFSV